MQEKNLYEYAVIRVVPKVEREEFLNVGIILFCKRAKFIKMLYTVNEAKLVLFSEDFDLEQLELNLSSFSKNCSRRQREGAYWRVWYCIPFSVVESAIRSSAIQTSRPHTGLCTDLEATVQHLFKWIGFVAYKRKFYKSFRWYFKIPANSQNFFRFLTKIAF